MRIDRPSGVEIESFLQHCIVNFRLPKKNNPNERTEFSGLNDFLQYIIDKDKQEKANKAIVTSSSPTATKNDEREAEISGK